MSDFRQRAERAHDEVQAREAASRAKRDQVAAEHLTTMLGTVLGIDLAQPLDNNTYDHEGIRFHVVHINGEWYLAGALILGGERTSGDRKIESMADVGRLYKNGKA